MTSFLFDRALELQGQTAGPRLRLHFHADGAASKKTQPATGPAGLTLERYVLVSADEDRADVERVLAGDPAAFEGIVRRWQKPLVNLAYRFCRDRGRAEDMAQEAFLRAFRALATWRREAAFSTWLFALSTNLYCSEVRRIPAPASTIGKGLELADQAAVDGGLERRDRDRAIRDAVQRLPARYRETMILFYFHDRDIAAVASGLGVPVGTVKARLSRGRDMLRKKLQALFSLPAKDYRHER